MINDIRLKFSLLKVKDIFPLRNKALECTSERHSCCLYTRWDYNKIPPYVIQFKYSRAGFWKRIAVGEKYLLPSLGVGTVVLWKLSHDIWGNLYKTRSTRVEHTVWMSSPTSADFSYTGSSGIGIAGKPPSSDKMTNCRLLSTKRRSQQGDSAINIPVMRRSAFKNRPYTDFSFSLAYGFNNKYIEENKFQNSLELQANTMNSCTLGAYKKLRKEEWRHIRGRKVQVWTV